MAEALVIKLAEDLANALYSKGKEKLSSTIKNEKSRQELEQAIQAFLDDFCATSLPYLSLDEEFDFGGFCDFLFSRQERLEEYFYGGFSGREAVLAVLRGEALAYAQPRRQSGRRLVLDCLDAVLAVMEQILLKRVDTKDMFLASRTGEQLRQATEKIVAEQAAKLHSHIDYRDSFAELVDSLETELPDDNRAYHYRNSKIGFYGREKELKYLDDFLDDEEPFLYTVITGPGGIGKSKLLYHYVRINGKDSAWKMLYLSRDIIEELCSHRREFYYPKSLLIVVDYVGQFPEEIGKWMAQIVGSRKKPYKMRLVLLERPSPEHNAKPEWYQKLIGRRKDLENFLWRKQFYQMELMGREPLMALMDNIARQERKSLTGQNRQDIYERVCSFHHQGQGGSPLYTILTTDAFLNEIPLTSLDTNKLMEYVLNRDEQYWADTICGGDGELYRSFREMLVYATATGGWAFTPLGEPLTEEADHLRKISQQGKTAVWEKFSQIVTQNDKGNPVLKPLEPDLIGEYFVLNYLRDQVADERYQARVRLFWEQLRPYASFLFRCVDSYLSQQAFQELLSEDKSVFWIRAENVDAAYLSALLMVNLTAKRDAVARAESVEQLRRLSEEYPKNEKIALAYANGLVNLTAAQDAVAGAETVERLRRLAEKYPQNEEIALAYAKGLVNLTAAQNAIDRAETVELLRILSEKYPQNEEIALEYANGLNNLTVVEDAVVRTETMERLSTLSGKYPKNEEITLRYVNVLFNVTFKQNAIARAQTTELLRRLSEKYPKNEEIACWYANGLFNLTADQDAVAGVEATDQLRKLSEKYPKNEEIACLYAKGLLNLTFKQDAVAEVEATEQLRKLSENYPENDDIACWYAYGLVNLTVDQDAVAGAETTERLRKLSEKYPEDEDIACWYAEGLFNLTVDQDAVAGAETAELLKRLSEKYPEIEDIAHWYAKGLFNLTVNQGAVAGGETVEQLRRLSEKYPENEEIALEYAKVLVNLTAKQNAVAGAETTERLNRLSEKYPENEEIALVYAKGLVILTAKQDAVAGAETTEQLRTLSEKYPKNEEIACLYAKGLFSLTVDQDAVAGAETTKGLRRLLEKYPDNEEIALAYVKGLVNLTSKQDAVAGAETTEQLRTLSGKYPENEEIALAYASGLFNLTVDQDAVAGAETTERLNRLSEKYPENEEIALVYAKGLAWLCAKERSEDIVIQECQAFHSCWLTDPEAVQRAVNAETDSHLKTLKLFLLEHTELFPEFMEWLVS